MKEKIIIAKNKKQAYKSKNLDKPYRLFLTELDDTSILPYEYERTFELKSVHVKPTVNTIGERAFAGCVKLERFDGAPSVVGPSAFEFCEAMKDFNFTNVNILDSGAFQYSGIEHADFGPKLTVVKDNAFNCCQQLEDVKLGNVESIEHHAFAGTKLFSIVINPSLKRIGNQAFEGCIYLNNIVVLSPEPPRICESTFYCTCLKNIWVPSEEVRQKFIKAKYWSEYADIIKIIDWEKITSYIIEHQNQVAETRQKLQEMCKLKSSVNI